MNTNYITHWGYIVDQMRRLTETFERNLVLAMRVCPARKSAPKGAGLPVYIRCKANPAQQSELSPGRQCVTGGMRFHN